jgi:hypothetical protein
MRLLQGYNLACYHVCRLAPPIRVKSGRKTTISNFLYIPTPPPTLPTAHPSTNGVRTGNQWVSISISFDLYDSISGYCYRIFYKDRNISQIPHRQIFQVGKTWMNKKSDDSFFYCRLQHLQRVFKLQIGHFLNFAPIFKGTVSWDLAGHFMLVIVKFANTVSRPFL